jgi:hypothetical protein
MICDDHLLSYCLCFQELENVVEAGERAAAEKRVKSRTLGTVRLIAELYRKEVVSENIIIVCIRELLEVGWGVSLGVCLAGGGGGGLLQPHQGGQCGVQ